MVSSPKRHIRVSDFSMIYSMLLCTGISNKLIFLICVGIPLVYELDKDLKPLKHYYLASDEEVKAAIDKVANQGKAK